MAGEAVYREAKSERPYLSPERLDAILGEFGLKQIGSLSQVIDGFQLFRQDFIQGEGEYRMSLVNYFNSQGDIGRSFHMDTEEETSESLVGYLRQQGIVLRKDH